MIYVDSSALMKLVRQEADSVALGEWGSVRGRRYRSSPASLGRVDVLRAARRTGGAALTQARVVIEDLNLVPLDRVVQDLACDIGDTTLRTLDALHLASATLLRDELTAFVAYDHRLVAAAKAAGLPTTPPSHAEPTTEDKGLRPDA